MKYQGRLCLETLPTEILDLIFDNIGVDFRVVQLVCRRFRSIAKRWIWSKVSIGTLPEATSDHVQFSCVNPEQDIAMFSSAAGWIHDLSICLQSIKDWPIEVIKQGLDSALDITLMADSESDPLLRTLVQYVKGSKPTRRLTIGLLLDSEVFPKNSGAWKFDERYEFGELYENEIVSIKLTWCICTCFQSPIESKGVLNNVMELNFHESISITKLPRLLAVCPNMSRLLLGKLTWDNRGRVILPSNICVLTIIRWEPGQGSLIRDNDDEPLAPEVVLSSEFLTHFTTHIVSFNSGAVTLDLPNVRALELTMDECDESFAKKFGQMRNLERLVLVRAKCHCLRDIAPVIKHVKEIEITFPKMECYSGLQVYTDKLVWFLRQACEARWVRLELPIFEPEPMMRFVKTFAQACPQLESFSMISYDQKKINIRDGYSSYMIDDFWRNTHRQRIFEFDLQFLLGSDALCYKNMGELIRDNCPLTHEHLTHWRKTKLEWGTPE